MLYSILNCALKSILHGKSHQNSSPTFTRSSTTHYNRKLFESTFQHH